jgi:hypothetical protein
MSPAGKGTEGRHAVGRTASSGPIYGLFRPGTIMGTLRTVSVSGYISLSTLAG